MDPEDANYKCTLSPYSLEKAKKELNEDPKERLGAVKALRKWVKEQPHLTCRTDTDLLLTILRKAKFSQLKARELIENIMKARSLFPEYMTNIDTHEPGLLAFIENGILVYPPKRDKEGRKLVIYRTGYIDLNDPRFSPQNEIRCSVALGEMLRDEDSSVNGLILVFDGTNFGMKHMTRIPMETHRKLSKIFQEANPERLKSFHFYNAGTVLEAIMTMAKQIMKKKLQERIHVHETMESLYKVIPMELWPDEYLPDDYKGPSAGSLESIQADLKKRLTDKATRNRILEITDARYKVDESKRPADSATNESFRKLNLD